MVLGINFALLLILITGTDGLRLLGIRCALQGSKKMMDETKIEGKLNELVKEFGGKGDPRYHKLAILARQARENQKKLKKSVDSLQESLDYLRICIKYQLFDLEATRRENEYLRKMLEENNKP